MIIAVSPLVQLALALALIVPGEPFFWVRLAGSLALCGFAIRGMAVDRHWARIREGLGLSSVGGLRAAFTAYLAAGLVATIAAFMYLQRGPAIIIAFFTISWVWMWGWALWRFPHQTDR